MVKGAHRMAARPKEEKDAGHWAKCGLPDAIAQYVAAWPENERANNDPMLLRARRFYDYWVKNRDDETTTFRHWKALETSAKSDDDLLMTFMSWPDAPTNQPYEVLYGKRKLSPDRERERYTDLADNIRKVLEFLSPHSPRKIKESIDENGDNQGLLDAMKDATKYPQYYPHFQTDFDRVVRGICG